MGMVDNRNSPQCLFSQHILRALLVTMVSITAFNFIASINFGSPRAPDDHDKFMVSRFLVTRRGRLSDFAAPYH